MITNKTYTILPFYDTTEKQWHNVYGRSYDTCPVIMPKNRMIPWEIQRTPDPSLVNKVELINICNDDVTDITALIPSGEIEIYTTDTYDYIQYLGKKDLSIDMDCGYYYLRVTDDNDVYYSEVFQVMDFEDTLDVYISYDLYNKIEVFTDLYLQG